MSKVYTYHGIPQDMYYFLRLWRCEEKEDTTRWFPGFEFHGIRPSIWSNKDGDVFYEEVYKSQYKNGEHLFTHLVDIDGYGTLEWSEEEMERAMEGATRDE